MRILLIAITTAISAALGGCVVALGTLITGAVHSYESSRNIAGVTASTNPAAVVGGTLIGALAGYLLGRVFFPHRE